MTTLSDYNNNPGNLRPPKGITYDGQIGVDDKGFAIFENKEYGQKALVNDLSYKLRHGVNTPEKFVDKYAPAGKENDEESRENYKLYLASQFGLKSTTDPFPEDGAEKLATAVGAFEGGTWNKPPEEKKEEAEADSTVAAQVDEGDRLPPGKTSDIPGEAEQTRKALGVIGGVAGTGTTAAIETTKKLAPLVPNILGRVAGNAPGPTTVMSRAGLQAYLNGSIAPNLRLSLSELEKVSKVGKIRTMSEVQQALKAIQAVEEKRATKPMVKMVPGRPGVFEQTGRFTTSTTPAKPPVDLSRYEIKQTGPVRQAIGRELQTAGEVGKAVLPSVGRIGIGGLSAANAMMQGYDAWEMAQKLKAMNDPSWVDYARLATKTMATVGGGLSMLPFAPTQAAGLALQAPEMGIEAYEFFKNRPQGGLPADETMTMDAMGNPVR